MWMHEPFFCKISIGFTTKNLILHSNFRNKNIYVFTYCLVFFGTIIFFGESSIPRDVYYMRKLFFWKTKSYSFLHFSGRCPHRESVSGTQRMYVYNKTVWYPYPSLDESSVVFKFCIFSAIGSTLAPMMIWKIPWISLLDLSHDIWCIGSIHSIIYPLLCCCLYLRRRYSLPDSTLRICMRGSWYIWLNNHPWYLRVSILGDPR
jgi:hypothetical protein